MNPTCKVCGERVVSVDEAVEHYNRHRSEVFVVMRIDDDGEVLDLEVLDRRPLFAPDHDQRCYVANVNGGDSEEADDRAVVGGGGADASGGRGAAPAEPVPAVTRCRAVRSVSGVGPEPGVHDLPGRQTGDRGDAVTYRFHITPDGDDVRTVAVTTDDYEEAMQIAANLSVGHWLGFRVYGPSGKIATFFEGRRTGYLDNTRGWVRLEHEVDWG